VKISNNFDLKEVVCKRIYTQYSERSIWFVTPWMINTLQSIRNYFGVPVEVNTWWKNGGNKQYRGHRPYDCPEGAPNSFHKMSLAVDFDVIGKDSIEVYNEIIKNHVKIGLDITTIESGTNGWNHVGNRNIDPGFREKFDYRFKNGLFIIERR